MVKPLKLEKLRKSNFAHFVSHLFGEKLRIQRPLLTKVKVFETFKIESLKKANFDHRVSRPLGEKLLKNLFWQKWWLLKTLKFENLKKVNFAHL